MRLEDQVCSVQLAKKLKELGVKQESLFQWTNTEQGGELNIILRFQLFRNEAVSAYTVAELGCLLREVGPTLAMKAYGDVFNFPGTGAIGDMGMLRLLTEPDRLAKMLIYLLETKLI